MSDASTETPALEAACRLDGLPAFERLLQGLEPARATVSAGGLWGSSQALVLAALSRRAQGPWVAVCSSDSEARIFADDLATLGIDSTWVPARESYSSTKKGGAHADVEVIRQRLHVARSLSGPTAGRPRLLVSSLLGILQPLPGEKDLEAELLSLAVGERLDAEHLLRRLTKHGFERQPLVESPGEVSLRGDILDIYPPASELPLRVELFDDEIDSLRTFDPADQRSVEPHDSLEICLASDTGAVGDEGVQPIQLLSPTAVMVQVEPLRIEDVAQGLCVQSADYAQAYFNLGGMMEARRRLKLQSLPTGGVNFDTRSVQALSVGVREAPAMLREEALKTPELVVLCQTAAEEHRFLEILGEAGGVPEVRTHIGALAKGFRLPAVGALYVNHRELTGILGVGKRQSRKSSHRARVIQSFFELKIGDLVVHAVHGLARFVGLRRMRRGEGEEEHLHLEFAEEVSLFVPASKLDLVQRYIGSGGGEVPLDKIGSTSFRRRKEKVQRALFDLASELLEVHAKRAIAKGRAWSDDDELVADMVGAFPYQETEDQLKTDDEIAADLHGERPMDRLLCGDVGFGKTELAVRAAFRVVNGGGQVAMLVPTTVLAQQHYETFSVRLADFPVRVASLSRYTAPKDTKETLRQAAAGEVDILIGTHRILSKDVSFERLGLIIVDEEQRFGVKHKEHFKKLRAEVDILTLTATPIPRTLHMSLSGVRDISALTIAPAGRQEIDTVLGYVEDDELVREAILREKNRGGQLFYLHNRVQTIEGIAQRLQRLVPECSFAIGHGQMGARELQRVMRTFTRGGVDVLVATTIIESGLDIPAAGTIVVHNAEQFGLSELHQLRGRVGRGANKGYCYLLVEEYKPLREVARERLKALEEMNQLGAGFAISMKDLEIRGAGNVLGPEQSGHISAVGYDLYCRLLGQVIGRLQEGATLEDLQSEDGAVVGVEVELGVRAFLPEDWIPDADTRLELMRELATIAGSGDLAGAVETLRDRFGRVPEPAHNLLRAFRIAPRLEELGVSRLAWQDEVYLIAFRDRVALEGWLGPQGLELRPIGAGMVHLVRPRKYSNPARGLSWLEELLKLPDGRPRMPRQRRKASRS